MSFKTKQKVTNATIIDKETGIAEEKAIISNQHVRLAEEYLRSYIEYIYELASILSPIEFVTFILLSHNVDYNTNSFKIDKAIKGRVCAALKYTDDRLMNIVSDLSKKGVLIREERGKYIVHPKYLFKGTEASREQVHINITIGQFNLSCDVANNVPITSIVNQEDLINSKLNA